MAVRQNPDWYVWVKDVLFWVVRPPQIYFIIIGVMGIALVYANTPQQYRNYVTPTSFRPAPVVNPTQQPTPEQQTAPRQNYPTAQDYAAQSQTDCKTAKGYFYNNICNEKPDPRCDIPGDVFITSRGHCVAPIK